MTFELLWSHWPLAAAPVLAICLGGMAYTARQALLAETLDCKINWAGGALAIAIVGLASVSMIWTWHVLPGGSASPYSLAVVLAWFLIANRAQKIGKALAVAMIRP